MSYNVFAYQVNSEKIKSIWGSNDMVFLDLLLSEYKDEIEEQLEWFDLDIDTYKAYLNDIIKAKITNNDNNYIYGYLYEFLCLKFGTIIESDEFMSYLEDVTEDNHKAFIPIPKNDDWPEFYSIYFNDLEDARQKFMNNKNEYAKEDYYIEEVNKIFDLAVKNKNDLVFFGY
jgi:hypothetical protein